MMPKNSFGKRTSRSMIPKFSRSINVGQFEDYQVSEIGLMERIDFFYLKMLIKLNRSILNLVIYRVYCCCSTTFKYPFSELNLRANFNKSPI